MTTATSYAEAYGDWMREPGFLLGRGSPGHHLDQAVDAVFDPTLGAFGQWFAGAMLNTCYNCLDRHVEAGRGDQAALIYDSPMTGTVQTFTYRDLLDRTARLAGALAALGVSKGDRVVIYMPMVPEAAIAMLAVARLGAIHSVVFGGFAGGGTVHADRRRPAEGDHIRLLRAGAGPGGQIQAAAGRGDRAVAAQAGGLPDPAAPPG